MVHYLYLTFAGIQQNSKCTTHHIEPLALHLVAHPAVPLPPLSLDPALPLAGSARFRLPELLRIRWWLR